MSDQVNPSLISPLRYPGGKGALAPFLGALIAAQERTPTTYVEPFAGGAGAALRLLYDEHVEHVVLNDIDAGVAAMWRSIVERSEEFAARIERVAVTMDVWTAARETYLHPSADDFELGFATFFLNRTNRSGILKARPIGGNGQTGRWKIDARFNQADLAARVRLIGRYRNRITVLEQDGIAVTGEWLKRRRNALVYVDPPYLSKARGLYTDLMSWQDHQRLAKLLTSHLDAPWMLTYDHDDRVPELYPGMTCHPFDIAHTAALQHVGREYAVFSDALEMVDLTSIGKRSVAS